MSLIFVLTSPRLVELVAMSLLICVMMGFIVSSRVVSVPIELVI